MNLAEFKASLSNQTQPPPGISPLLQALWHEGQGDWNAAHELIQNENNRDGAWVHAYLHRKEGDQANAAYWYSRAAQPVSQASLDQEWEQIVEALLKKND
jgi:hypothetical protein